MTRGLALPMENREAKNALYGYYKREVERRKNEFVMTDELKQQISEVGDFLTTETRYYGLFLPGSIGNGKTTMLKAIRDLLIYLVENDRIRYCEGDKYPRFVTARDMTNIAKDADEFRSLKTTKYLILDDLCEEPAEVLSFGNYIYPFVELLEYRYEQMLPTFISSNFGAVDIEEKYHSARISDRMKEMFKIISFKEESFR
jgi:DNA replication protein DnaC